MGLLISVLIHAGLLSLQLGVPGLGLPGLQLPWNKERAVMPELAVTLTDVQKKRQPSPASNPDYAPERPYESTAREKPLDATPMPSVAPKESTLVWTPLPQVTKVAEPLRTAKATPSRSLTPKARNKPVQAHAAEVEQSRANFLTQQDNPDASFSVPVASPEVTQPEITPVKQETSSEENTQKLAEQQAAREQEQAEAERKAQQAEQARKIQEAEATRQEEARVRRQIEEQEMQRRQAEKLAQQQQLQEQQQEEERRRVQQLEQQRQQELEQRLAAERSAQRQAEEDRITRQREEANRLAQQRAAETARIEAERAMAERVAAERAATQRAAEERAGAERAAAERIAAERAAAARAAQEKAAAAPVDDFASMVREQARKNAAARDAVSRQGESSRRRSIIGRIDQDIGLKMYVLSWKQKIERNGNLNYSQSSKDKARGDPLVNVAIRSDGSVEEIVILRSSGRVDLDEAVRRIVRINARYSAFPPELAARYDVIEIRRVWNFDESLRLVEEF